MTVNTVVLKLCAFFGDGEQYSQKGWTLAFVCLTIAFVVLNLITFFFCKERVTGVQAVGMGNASSSFCMKVGSGIGTAALGWILDADGFL